MIYKYYSVINVTPNEGSEYSFKKYYHVGEYKCKKFTKNKVRLLKNY